MSKVLITAGATEVPIDRVRAISNIFKGKTGWKIAEYFNKQKHDVTLITSGYHESLSKLRIVEYRTFDDLAAILEREVRTGKYDVIIHSAAISDYAVSNVLVPDEKGTLQAIDNSTKVSSQHPVMYLKLCQTPKLVDLMREPWGFKGKLVKFKLQVAISDPELLEIAKKSINLSKADLLIANCLEWSKERAYLVTPEGNHYGVMRDDLPAVLYKRLLG